jgi:PIN domain nuclease of toxin-antitoxin system
VTGSLLDTNIALLGLASPERIPLEIRQTIETRPVHLSVISYWEVVLKSGKGKLDVGEPRAWWMDALDKLAATPLHLKPDHISEIFRLKSIHTDPFDRALIAQATVENLVFVTTDQVVAKYASERFRVTRF